MLLLSSAWSTLTSYFFTKSSKQSSHTEVVKMDVQFPACDFLVFYRTLPSMIYYSTDAEYRQSIRKVFDITHSTVTTGYSSFDASDMCDPKEMDEVSRDETNINTGLLDTRMEILYNVTYQHDFFNALYLSAAGQMMSTDLKIGQAVVCCYDTFQWYHTAVWVYLVRGDISEKSVPECEKLYKYFSIA